MIARQDIYQAARKFLNVPFLHQGRTSNGLDCIGLLWVTANDLGCDLSTMPNAYSRTPSGDRIMEHADRLLVKPERQGWSKLLPGDIVCLWGWQANVPQHFAIIGELSERLTMIHAFQRAGMVVEHNTIPFWASRYVSTYCIPGTERLEG